jgi:hypothetical protein
MEKVERDLDRRAGYAEDTVCDSGALPFAAEFALPCFDSRSTTQT